ncbi:hypothetical protein CDD82_6607 [Ophiocordyceps australis]|uniref:OPT family small oligopeptide transporter n=1 Tax=Ophiocordyceps australis TaxID=1399860 RepID=A0A2C5YUR2_9HYPO|nr:hypothetical protein CDD82_6607 [Ophiocordyceps australis]
MEKETSSNDSLLRSDDSSNPTRPQSGEKRDAEKSSDVDAQVRQLDPSEDEILEAKEVAAGMTLERAKSILQDTVKTHNGDPNFPFETLSTIKEYLSHKDMDDALAHSIKLQAALLYNNSPYPEVRGVVDNHDDPSTPASTLRGWILGIVFSIIVSAVNQLFSIRLPGISIGGTVVQLLAYPVGKAWERWVPCRELRVPFTSLVISTNPGPFNQKEHMLITIMSITSGSGPISSLLIWSQALPQYFNQQYARSFGYIFLNTFATNFIGYGFAGLIRTFLVYPSFCIWPRSLVTIALNKAMHAKDEGGRAISGPFNSSWRISRYRLFFYVFGFMFVYTWFPNFIFQALSYFSWMTWIAPHNVMLNVLTGMKNGLGLFNPFSTLDWNILSQDPLTVPAWSTFNSAAGMFLGGLCILAMWSANVWNTAFLPINTNQNFDHFGKPYNISAILTPDGFLDDQKYANYSAAYISAGFIMSHVGSFAIYSAMITYVVLYHWHELKTGYKNVFQRLLPEKWTGGQPKRDKSDSNDVHILPEWWYLLILVVAFVFGILAIALYPTHTSPVSVLYGILLSLAFIVPTGILTATTGISVYLVVLGQFLGGLYGNGNALAMNYFQSYATVTASHALTFANDLKLGHYLKLPPRVTFSAQVVSTVISSIIVTGMLKYQMTIKDVCTPNAPFRFYCPWVTSWSTESVLWGTIGPEKVFGIHGQYSWLLLGFPIGMALVIIFWGICKLWPNSRALRSIHIPVLISGASGWGIYSFSYMFPAVPIAWFSWVYIRGRYPALWAKYNFVLSAALSAGVAVSAIFIFFTVQLANVEINWWGNSVISEGCESYLTPCTGKTLAEGERFYPWWDGTKTPAP